MQKTYSRSQKISDQIQKDLSQILRLKVKDPRINWVTINEVEVSKDLSIAKIYYTILDKQSIEDVKKSLEKAKGFIRSELSKGLTTYTSPQLRFIYDESLERGGHILDLIHQVNNEK